MAVSTVVVSLLVSSGRTEEAPSPWGPSGYWLQVAGFGLVLGSQAGLEASSTRDAALIGGAGLFVAGMVMLLTEAPTPKMKASLPPALSLLPARPSAPPVWAPPRAMQSLKTVKGVNVRDGIEIERVSVAIAAPLLGFEDRMNLSPSGKSDRVFSWLADAYRQTGRSMLTLIIHVSPSMDPEGDRRLSQSRADQLFSICVDREGLARDRVVSVAAGAGQPLVEPTHPEAAKINNRVEVLFQRAAGMGVPEGGLDRLEQSPGVQVRRELEAVESAILATEEAILFDVNSAKPTKTSERALTRIADVLREMTSTPGAVRVKIEGHTDAAGDPAYNQKLSRERAEAVAKYFMVTQQFSPTLFEAIGHGAAVPLAENTTPENRAKNRRVQLTITKTLVP